MSDSQIVHHNPCFNLFILHNNSFDNEGNETNKNGIFLRNDTLSFIITMNSTIYSKNILTHVFINSLHLHFP